MAISLYDVSVPSYLQHLRAVSGFLDKAASHCEGDAVALSKIVEARVFADMLPFRFQIQSVVFHSRGAIEAIKNGGLSPPSDLPPNDYAGLQTLVASAIGDLAALTPEEINAYSGAEVFFRSRRGERVFTAEGFVLSFSLPNFYFHAATAYDILRGRGVPLGKMDFMGAFRLKNG